MISYLITIIILILFSAFFSGTEIAFVSANRLRIELDRVQGGFPSGLVAYFSRNSSQFIATMLIGNNIVLVMYGSLMVLILEPYIKEFSDSDFWIFIIQTITSTIIILLTGEFLPKVLFRINPNRILRILALPVAFFYIILYPIAIVTLGFTNFMLRKVLKVKVSKKQHDPVFGKIDLDNFLNQSTSDIAESEEGELDLKIFQNALDFANIKLRECITPRNEIQSIDINSPIEDLKKMMIESGFSKILVFDKSSDNLIGYVHIFALFGKPKDLRSVLVDLIIVPETMPANKLLDRFIKEHKSIAVVVDEFGITSGIVTIEDIMEEIFGEIEDEHDYNELEEKKISPTEYIFAGRLEIDYLNEKYDLNIPISDEYETLAGFIIYHHDTIPETNDEIVISKFYFKIIKVEKPRIELVQLKIAH